jgi:hypothetical protein
VPQRHGVPWNSRPGSSGSRAGYAALQKLSDGVLGVLHRPLIIGFDDRKDRNLSLFAMMAEP